MWDWQIESELDRLLGIKDNRMDYVQLAISAKEQHESTVDSPYTNLVESLNSDKKKDSSDKKKSDPEKVKRDLEIIKLSQERSKLLKLQGDSKNV